MDGRVMRQKISKSDGKPQTADDYVRKYGADIVRLWVASENYQSDIPLSDANVAAFRYAAGEQVADGAALLEFEAANA